LRALVAAAGASTFLKKKLAKFGALKTSNPQLQLAELPENEVLTSVQINLFARLDERNITPGRVKTECVGGQRDKIFGLESCFNCGVESLP